MKAPKVAASSAVGAGGAREARPRTAAVDPRRTRPAGAPSAVLARPLGVVEGDVGGLDERRGVARVRLERAHADADRRPDRPAVRQPDLDRGDGAAEALVYRIRAGDVC